MTNAMEPFFDAWKQQVETSVRVMDALVEADAKLRSSQLSAANETHERAQALEKALADCRNAQELWGAQWNWALATCERSAAYWRNLFEVMQEANAKMARCVQERVQGAAQAQQGALGGGELPATGFPAFDQAYRELLKASQQFFPAMTGRSEPKTRA
jgi:hypothetical protein